jgi:hypothetical protein
LVFGKILNLSSIKGFTLGFLTGVNPFSELSRRGCHCDRGKPKNVPENQDINKSGLFTESQEKHPSEPGAYHRGSEAYLPKKGSTSRTPLSLISRC